MELFMSRMIVVDPAGTKKFFFFHTFVQIKMIQIKLSVIFGF